MSKDFLVHKIKPEFVHATIEEIGFDKSYINKVKDKYNFTLLRVYGLKSPQATIIKQLALSLGTDAAVHREVITCKVEHSDVLIAGSISQIKNLAKKLKSQPFSLSILADKLLEQIDSHISPLQIRDTNFNWGSKTYIMGILNVTPDSFSDGGIYTDIQTAITHAKNMIEQGADIIDIGGETTKPFSKETPINEELKRVLPVIKGIREFSNIPISIDTRHSLVAKQAIESGADIINDVSGFDFDSQMLETVAQLQCPYILMHSQGSPDTMQINPQYEENIISSIIKSLNSKIKQALKAGIKKENIIIDPGIGFGKTFEHNIEIIQRINEFESLGCPILMGISRKSVISKVLGESIKDKEDANIALNSYLATNGTNIIRVHDVEKHAKAFKVLDKIIKPTK